MDGLAVGDEGLERGGLGGDGGWSGAGWGHGAEEVVPGDVVEFAAVGGAGVCFGEAEFFVAGAGLARLDWEGGVGGREGLGG